MLRFRNLPRFAPEQIDVIRDLREQVKSWSDKYADARQLHMEEVAALKVALERAQHEERMSRLAKADRDGAYLAMTREKARADRLQAELDARK